MSTFQRVVKYIGIAFALTLAVSIIGGIAAAAMGIGRIGKHVKSDKEISVSSGESSFDRFDSIDIECGAANVIVQTGSDYSVETHNVPEDMVVKVDNDGTLKIGNKGGVDHIFTWFDGEEWGRNAKIIVTVPDSFSGDQVDISAGAGNIELRDIVVSDLDLDGGAGNITAENVVAENATIEAGAGKLKMTEVKFGDTEIECGVGKVEFDGTIVGNCDVSGGVGSIDMRIQGSERNYNMEVESGVGTIRVNGKKVDNMEQDNDASYDFQVDGGVGSVNIEFTED